MRTSNFSSSSWSDRRHRQAADEFRDQPVTEEILGLQRAQELGQLPVLASLQLRSEADPPLSDPSLDDLLQTHEGPPADEQDIGGVHLEVFLLGVLPAALGRHVGHGSLQDLEQRLLDTFAGHVASDGGILGLAGDLVDFVDVDNAALRPLHVIIRHLQQPEDDILHVLADVAGLRQRGGVGDGEGNLQDLGQGLGEERLAGAGGADEQDV